jgi:Cytosine deaminase and related metal-dependent hydrolases
MKIQNQGVNVEVFGKLALISEGWAHNVRNSISEEGKNTNVESRVMPGPEELQLRNRILLPARANLHSHSFQRTMAGMKEKRAKKQESSWSGRELIYSGPEKLNPEHIEAIAALVPMEMRESGNASVGEYHDLQHQQGGQPNENIAETSSRIMAAAIQTGMGITHAPVHNMQGGINGEQLPTGQLRWGNNAENNFRIPEQNGNEIQTAPKENMLGMGPHSLRAVSPEAVKEKIDSRKLERVHNQNSEEEKEVEEIQKNKRKGRGKGKKKKVKGKERRGVGE